MIFERKPGKDNRLVAQTEPLSRRDNWGWKMTMQSRRSPKGINDY